MIKPKMFAKVGIAAWLCAAMVGISAAAVPGNKCSGSTVYEPPFPSYLTCKDVDCGAADTDDCKVPATTNGSDATGSYYWCPCGDETEPACCHFILRDVWGADTPDVAGKCKDCVPPLTGECKLNKIKAATWGAACITDL